MRMIEYLNVGKRGPGPASLYTNTHIHKHTHTHTYIKNNATTVPTFFQPDSAHKKRHIKLLTKRFDLLTTILKDLPNAL